jgi:hypothetical protein
VSSILSKKMVNKKVKQFELPSFEYYLLTAMSESIGPCHIAELKLSLKKGFVPIPFKLTLKHRNQM